MWSAAIASASLVAQHVAGKATRDTLFLSHFGLGLLPAAMIGAALVSSVAVVGISRALGKYGPARIVPVMLGSAAVLFMLEWRLSLHSARGAAIAVYVHTAIYGSAVASAFWSLVNERFDPHSAQLQDEAQVTLPRDEVVEGALHELTEGRTTWKDQPTQPRASTSRRCAASPRARRARAAAGGHEARRAGP